MLHLALRLWMLFLLVDPTSEFNTDVSITEPQFPRSFMVLFSKIHNTVAILYSPAAKSEVTSCIPQLIIQWFHISISLELLNHVSFLLIDFIKPILLTLLLGIIPLIDPFLLPPQDKC